MPSDILMNFHRDLPIFRPKDCFFSLPDHATFVFSPPSIDSAALLDYVKRRAIFDPFESISLRGDRPDEDSRTI